MNHMSTCPNISCVDALGFQQPLINGIERPLLCFVVQQQVNLAFKGLRRLGHI